MTLANFFQQQNLPSVFHINESQRLKDFLWVVIVCKNTILTSKLQMPPVFFSSQDKNLFISRIIDILQNELSALN